MIQAVNHVMVIASSVLLLVACAMFVSIAPHFPKTSDRAILFSLAALAFAGGIL
jgi:hypothetical protein